MRQPDWPQGRRDPRVYLLDMQQAIELVRVAMRGKTVAEYECDAILRSAVERQLITIGLS